MLEAISNSYIAHGAPELGESQIQKLLSLGWLEPDDNSLNFYRDVQVTSEYEMLELATVLTRTLREVYGVTPHDPLHVEWNERYSEGD